MRCADAILHREGGTAHGNFQHRGGDKVAGAVLAFV